MRAGRGAGRLRGVDAPPPTDAPIADDDPGWPLHERLAGAGVRTAAVGLALLPAGLFVAVEGNAKDAAVFLGLALVVAFPILAAERRDRGVVRALLWLAAGAAAGTLLVPIAFVSVKFAGDPMGALAEAQRLLGRGGLALPIGAALAGLLAAVFGALPVVRTRTRRVGPQVVAGLMTVVVFVTPALPALNQVEEVLAALTALLSGTLVPVLLVLGERWTDRLDPRAPAPVERDARPVLAAFTLVMLLGGFLPALSLRPAFYKGGSVSAREVARSFAEAVRADASRARSLVELRAAGPGPRSGFPARDVLDVRRDLFLVRLVASPDGRRWALVVDPVAPGSLQGSWAAFSGQSELEHHAGPLRLDPRTCQPEPEGP